MTDPTYTNRDTAIIQITEVNDEGVATFETVNGYCFGNSFAARPGVTLTPGVYVAEVRNLSQLVGLRPHDGDWLYRDSDQDLDAARERLRADLERRDRERLERNRADWARRTAALPAWGRDRLARFGEAGGETFALRGWHYELVVCELAALYASGAPQADVDRYDAEHGCSVNQHDCAQALARLVTDGHPEAVGAVPAGLSPITGSADYS